MASVVHWSSPDLLTYIAGPNLPVNLDEIEFDLDCSKGQPRPLSDDLVQEKMGEFEKCPPTQVIGDILVWQCDATGAPPSI